MSQTRFQLLDPSCSESERQVRSRELSSRSGALPSLRSHRTGAAKFQPSDELVTAINIAIAVQAPLLLTGEPGTGKTQVAYYLAWYFDLEDRLYTLDVRSTTTVSDLLYRFDTVAYFHAAQDHSRKQHTLDRGEFVDKGPLWLAFEARGPAVVLIDEIDKATRDFPNDLLNVLDQHEFQVPDLPHKDNKTPVITLPEDTAPPLVVITSNSERRLPEPFLRRCIFHHIEFTETILRKAVQAHMGAFPNLAPELIDIALEKFMEIRRRPLRKKPATAEFLVWLSVLSALGGIGKEHLRRPLSKLPALATLVKDRDDLGKL